MNARWLVMVTLLAPAAALGQTDTTVLLDGGRVTHRVTAIADGKVHFESDDQPPVDLQGLRRIERGLDESPFDAAARVYLVGGGMVRASSVVMDETACTVEWAFGEPLRLPIEMVRAIRLSDQTDASKLPGNYDTFDKTLADASERDDRLFVIVEGKVQSLAGVFVGMTADAVKFEYEGAQRTVEREKVFALLLTRIGKTPDLTGKALLHLTDGSSFWTTIRSMQSGLARVTLVGGGDVPLPWATVRRIDVRSDRLMFLSDVEPVDVYEKAIAHVGPWRRNLSVRGRPLSLRGQVFEKGFGVHAVTRLTFETNAKFPIFAATIGIDDFTKGKGDCEFVVLGDDKELYRKRIRGADEPVQVRVDLTGYKQFTLAVERGEDLDFSDHGDWCDARLIAKTP